MPLTKPVITITWPTGQATGSVSAGGNLTSEAFTIAVDEASGELVLVATSGATDSGYNVIFYLLGSADGTNYSNGSADTARRLGVINLAAVSTTYRSSPINLPLGLEDYKIYVESDNADTDATIIDVEMKALKTT